MPAASPPPLPKPAPRLRPQPTLFGAWRGIWLFTWRSQMVWRRLPMGLVTLLALPLLVYITTSPPRAWAQRHSWAANPPMQIDGFSRRLSRQNLTLQPEQQADLLRIFSEEYARANSEMNDTESPELSVSEQADQIKSCHDRIRDRARAVLDKRQFSEFQAYEKRKLDDSVALIGRPRWSRTGPFYHWLIDFYFFMILPLNCVRVCGGLIRDELQADTLGFLTTRPLSRAKLLVLKYFSQTAWLQALVFLEALLLFAAGYLRQIPSLGVLLPLFLAAQFVAVLAWSALGTFFGQVTKRYMALALIYGFVVELGIGNIPTNINTLSLMRHFKTLLAQNSALQNTYQWIGPGVPLSLTALALATALFLSLAALLFTVKEYHHSEEMQK